MILITSYIFISDDLRLIQNNWYSDCFQIALKNEYRETLRVFLDKLIAKNPGDEDLSMFVHICIIVHDFEFVEKLFDEMEDRNAKNYHGWTPLQTAEKMKTVIIDEKRWLSNDDFGWTPLKYYST